MRRWEPNRPAEVVPALAHGWWKGWRGPNPLTDEFRDRSRVSVSCSHLPLSEAARERAILIPMYASLTDADQDRVVDALRTACGAG